ncbi:sterile alpha motif domain containing 1 [Nesidiocoris tenuis]|uniref:Sterile alpha motif domain containing 1 n=1 Tax=Nesidiocoris tenuis TaxID=355587 RepID=A0ABN7B6Y6_9HEMI|nr:sterile alpha motif domain containing 1 [Nesidiocoris tenuis]
MKRKSQNTSGKKADLSSKPTESLNGLVGDAMNFAFMAKADYISSGVPAVVLESKIASEVSVRMSDMDSKQVIDKCKELIAVEIEKETLIKNDSGHYSFGPKKIEMSGLATMKDDEARMKEDESSCSMYGDEGDDDDDFDDTPRSKRAGKKVDEDYEPPSSATIKKAQGRSSSRTIKSRFESDEFVYPLLLKQKNRKSVTSPETSLKKAPPKRQKLEEKPKKYACAECGKLGLAASLSVFCKTCPERAHPNCLTAEAKDDWTCYACKFGGSQSPWTCSVCGSGLQEQLGALIRCVACEFKYHRSCHKPIILARNVNKWKCSSCGPAKFSSALKAIKTSKISASSSLEPPNFPPNPSLCSKCKDVFPNSVDKLFCIVCNHLYHAKCCRARDVTNILRLGARKQKWRCDHCVVRKPVKPDTPASSKTSAGAEPPTSPELSPEDLKLQKEIEEEEEKEHNLRKMLDLDSSKENAWWKYRLRKIVVGLRQPPLGPIPDPSVPDYRPWDATKVREYFDKYFTDKRIGNMFMENDVDGKALRLLRRTDIESFCLDSGLKLDITMDIIAHVKRLQLRVNDRRYIWADIY